MPSPRELKKSARARQRRVENPNKYRDKRMQRAYGITFADAAKMWTQQGCRCPVCRDPIPFPGRHTHIDHCHATHKVRGILCRRCNQLLGHYEAWPDSHIFARQYLERGHVV